MKSPRVLVLFALLLASPARAAGINLSWQDCGTHGLALEQFACNSNIGAHPLFTSFVSPVPMTQLVMMDFTIDVSFQSGVVPSWWLMQSSGGCRVTGYGMIPNNLTGPFTCADPWMGMGVGAVRADPDVPSPGRLRLRSVEGVPSDAPMTVDDVTEYYAIETYISNAKTTGTGACAGCPEPACLILVRLGLYQPVGVGDFILTQPLDNVVVGWQCPAYNGAPGPTCFQCPVPNRRSTWGSVKQLYR